MAGRPGAEPKPAEKKDEGACNQTSGDVRQETAPKSSKSAVMWSGRVGALWKARQGNGDDRKAEGIGARPRQQGRPTIDLPVGFDEVEQLGHAMELFQGDQVDLGLFVETGNPAQRKIETGQFLVRGDRRVEHRQPSVGLVSGLGRLNPEAMVQRKLQSSIGIALDWAFFDETGFQPETLISPGLEVTARQGRHQLIDAVSDQSLRRRAGQRVLNLPAGATGPKQQGGDQNGVKLRHEGSALKIESPW